MNFHKKLARAGWSQGKRYKAESNRTLRQQARTEESDRTDARIEQLQIKSEIQQETQTVRDIIYGDVDIPIKEINRQFKKEMKRLDIFNKNVSKEISSVRYILSFIKRWNMTIEDLNSHGNSWTCNLQQSYYQQYKRLQPKLLEYLNNREVSNKNKQRIRELL